MPPPQASLAPPGFEGDMSISVDDLPGVRHGRSPTKVRIAGRSAPGVAAPKTPPMHQQPRSAPSPSSAPQNQVQLSAASRQLTEENMATIWAGVCRWVGDTLKKRRAVVIPRFGQFTFKQVDMDEGTWGRKYEHTPVFVMSTAFAQQHRLSAVKHTAQTALCGQIQTMTLNSTVIALQTSTTREMVNDCVKEVVRRFGQQASERSVTMDLGFGRISVSQRKYTVSWSEDLMERVREIEKLENHREVAKIQKQRGVENKNPYTPHASTTPVARTLSHSGSFNKTRNGEEVYGDGFEAGGEEEGQARGGRRKMERKRRLVSHRHGGGGGRPGTGAAAESQAAAQATRQATPARPPTAPLPGPAAPDPEDAPTPIPRPSSAASSRPGSASTGTAVNMLRQRRMARQKREGERANGATINRNAGSNPTEASNHATKVDGSPVWDPNMGTVASIEWSPFPGKALVRNVIPLEEGEDPMAYQQHPHNSTRSDMESTGFSPSSRDFSMSQSQGGGAGGNYWVKRKQVKAAHRAKRKKAYMNSWNEQIGLKEQRKKEEKEDDRRRADAYLVWSREEQAKELERTQELKQIEKDAANQNERIMRERLNHSIPKSQPMGHLFEGWSEIKPRPHDLEFLKHQVEERENTMADEKRKETELEKRLGEQAAETHKEQLAAEKLLKRRRQAEVAQGYDEQLSFSISNAQSRQELDSRFDSMGGNLFFRNRTAEQLADDEKKEAREKRQRLIELNRKNMEDEFRMKEERKEQASKEQAEDRAKAEAARQKVLDEMQHEREHTRQVQGEMREIWENQATLRKAELKRQSSEERGYKQVAFWGNESSDECEDPHCRTCSSLR